MRHPHHLPICLAVALASGAWGLYWLPQRALEHAGLTGGWSTIAQFLVPLAMLAPVALWRWREGRPSGLGMPALGILMGGGIVCYANAFLLTDVVRALLLFYLTPVWASLLELVVLRRRIGPSRIAGLTLALAGVWLVVGTGSGWPVPHNVGDWMALAGGMMIAAGATRAEAVQPQGIVPLLVAYFAYGAVVALASSVLFAADLGPAPSPAALLAMLPWLALLAVVFLLPTNGLLIWSPARIGAGLFGILILSEVVFGTVSAALWANEPYGWREATGSALIVLAGLCEVLWARRPVPAPA